MSMVQELEKKAKAAGVYTIESVQRDIENKDREIENAKLQLESLHKEIEWTSREAELFKKISDVMLESYGKVDTAKEHLWEENPEYYPERNCAAGYCHRGKPDAEHQTPALRAGLKPRMTTARS